MNRRRFVQGITTAGMIAPLGGTDFAAFAESTPPTLQELSGPHFDLTIDHVSVSFTGHRKTALGINGTSPGPTLRWREDETVTMAVNNRLSVPASIHWHGMRIPTDMDGVPGLSYSGIAPGETFHYRFPVLQNGTYCITVTPNFRSRQVCMARRARASGTASECSMVEPREI